MITYLCVELGHEAMAGKECAALRNTVEQALAHIVELPAGSGHSFKAKEVILVAHLRLAGVGVEGRAHVEGVGHGHDLVDDHRVPVLAGHQAVVLPPQVDVGVAQAQVVDGGVGAAGG